MKRHTGGCLCGDVRFTAEGQPDRVCICHCLDCRKFHGATIRREDWLPVFPVDERFERDR